MMTEGRTTREQRIVWGGALVITCVLAVRFGVIPGAGAWRTRTAQVEQLTQRLETLQALVAQQTTLERRADAAERAVAAAPRRVVRARSATLGASGLQALLQDAADAHHVVVTRVAVEADSAASMTRGSVTLPASISVYGDITGITGFLEALQTGPRVVQVASLVMQRNAALAGGADVVQLTLSLRMPLVLE